LFFIKPGVKDSGQCCWDILLSQQMLDAMKNVVDEILAFFLLFMLYLCMLYVHIFLSLPRGELS